MIGFIAGSFDLIHPGYIYMFEKAKENCDYLVVALHEDPTVERPNKIKPVLSLSDRKKILESIKYVDEIKNYKTEKDLELILTQVNPDVRFLGDDYSDKNYTGKNLNIKIIFLDRAHGWSTTKLKNEIYDQLKKINK